MKGIVYTSNTGHTNKYAEMIGEKLDLRVYSLSEAEVGLEKGSEIIYLGWLFVNKVKGYERAKKRFKITAVCGVGLCDTGTAIDGVRKANKMPRELPVFTLQGGMDKEKLRGINSFMIKMLIKMTEAKKDKTADDRRMLYLLTNDKDYVGEESLKAFTEWYGNYKA